MTRRGTRFAEPLQPVQVQVQVQVQAQAQAQVQVQAQAQAEVDHICLLFPSLAPRHPFAASVLRKLTLCATCSACGTMSRVCDAC